MIHPSYVDLMEVVNKNVEEGETPVINSRYSIVMATAKRARQIVDGDEPLVKVSRGEKPLSTAVDELNQGAIRILAEDEVEEEYVVGTASSDGEEDLDTEEAFKAEENAVEEAAEVVAGSVEGSAEETAAEDYSAEELSDRDRVPVEEAFEEETVDLEINGDEQ